MGIMKIYLFVYSDRRDWSAFKAKAGLIFILSTAC